MTQSLTVEDSTSVIAAHRAATVIYALLATTPVLWLAPVAAAVVAYVAREAAGGSWVASHLRWQSRTFWFGFLWFLLGGLTVYLLIGFAIWGVAAVWFAYRVAHGWLRLTQRLPMYADG